MRESLPRSLLPRCRPVSRSKGRVSPVEPDLVADEQDRLPRVDRSSGGSVRKGQYLGLNDLTLRSTGGKQDREETLARTPQHASARADRMAKEFSPVLTKGSAPFRGRLQAGRKNG